HLDVLVPAGIYHLSLHDALPISADGVVAMASSTIENSNAEGSSLGNLVVNGLQVDDPAPNTRVNLPGVGYVVLNEQIPTSGGIRSEEHTSELQSRSDLVCRLLLE